MRELLTITMYTLRDPIWQTLGVLSSMMIVAVNSMFSLLQKGNRCEASQESAKHVLHYGSIIAVITIVSFIAIIVAYRMSFVRS